MLKHCASKRIKSLPLLLIAASLGFITYSKFSGRTDVFVAVEQPQYEGPPLSEELTSFKSVFDRYGDCGTWHAEYSRLHEDILIGVRAPRFVNVVGVESGLAGAISAFYYGLLTGRAFQISTYGELPALELALKSAGNVNWTAAVPRDDLLTPVKITYEGFIHHPGAGREYASDTDHQKYGFIYHVREDLAAEAMFRNSNFSQDPQPVPHAETVFFASNRGRSFRLFDNAFYAERLRGWGLKPENAWQCAFGYLFRPTAGVAPRFRREIEALSDPHTLKIGINVRVGEWDETVVNSATIGNVFKDAEYDLDRAKAYFDCAQQIEETRKTEGQNVIWYLISDSIGLRQAAQKRYGDKLLTNPDLRVIHPNCHRYQECLGNQTAKVEAMTAAVGQLMTFAMTDFQVVTRASGFGRVGAMIGSWRNSMYQIDGEFAHDGLPRACDPQAADSYEYVATSWAGL